MGGLRDIALAKVTQDPAKLNSRDIEILVEAYPSSLLPYRSLLSLEQFNHCIQERPGAALRYGFVCFYLNDKQLDYCIRTAPYEALKYVKALLTHQQVISCEKRCAKRGINVDFCYKGL